MVDGGYKVRVLIADDDAGVRSALCLTLQETGGISVAEAKSADELLAAVKEKCPDLVLLDWELPRITGGEIIQTIRVTCPGIPIIVLSSSPEVKIITYNR